MSIAMTIYPRLVLDALSTVRYPGNGKSIVENEMVTDDIQIDGLKVHFAITFPKNPDPFSKSVVKAAEAAVRSFASTEAEVTIDVRYKENAGKTDAEDVPAINAKHIIAVSSGKGGVGKSTVAANLAISLARMGHRVGLLDTDIFGPSIPKMFQVEGQTPFASEVQDENNETKTVIEPIEQYGVKLLSIGFFINADQPTLWRGAMACNALKQLITEANWGELDYFILDTPPGTSDIHLSLLSLLKITGAVIVSTPQQVALADARKGINMYLNDKVNVPILGLVENMAWFTPRELPDNKYYIFGKEGCKALAQELNVPLLAQIPLVQGICEDSDSGLPPSLKPSTPEGIAYMSLAAKVVTQVDKLSLSKQ